MSEFIRIIRVPQKEIYTVTEKREDSAGHSAVH